MRVSQSPARLDSSTGEDGCGPLGEGPSERRPIAGHTFFIVSKCDTAVSRNSDDYSPVLWVLSVRDARVANGHVEQLQIGYLGKERS